MAASRRKPGKKLDAEARDQGPRKNMPSEIKILSGAPLREKQKEIREGHGGS